MSNNINASNLKAKIEELSSDNEDVRGEAFDQLKQWAEKGDT